MEMTQENFDKLMAEAEKAKGLQNALHQAREDNKTLKSQMGELNERFSEIEKNKASAKEQELIKKGKLEQLLEQKNQALADYEAKMTENAKKLEELSGVVSEYNTYKEAQQAKALEALTSKLESLEEAKRNTVLELIKDKPIERQQELVDQLLSLQWTPDYKVNPNGWDKPKIDTNQQEFAKAKESGDTFNLIKWAKVLS